MVEDRKHNKGKQQIRYKNSNVGKGVDHLKLLIISVDMLL